MNGQQQRSPSSSTTTTSLVLEHEQPASQLPQEGQFSFQFCGLEDLNSSKSSEGIVGNNFNILPWAPINMVVDVEAQDLEMSQLEAQVLEVPAILALEAIHQPIEDEVTENMGNLIGLVNDIIKENIGGMQPQRAGEQDAMEEHLNVGFMQRLDNSMMDPASEEHMARKWLHMWTSYFVGLEDDIMVLCQKIGPLSL